MLQGQTVQRAHVLCTLASLAGIQGDVRAAARWLDQAHQSTRATPDVEIEVDLLLVEGMLAAFRGDIRSARDVGERGRRLAQRAGLHWLEARHLHNLSDIAIACGDTDEARRLITECLRVARTAGDTWNTAMASNGLGDVLRSAGDYAQAERAYADAVEIFNSIEEHSGMPRGAWAGLPHNLGYVTLALGSTDRAIHHFMEAADRYQRYGPDWRGVAECVMGLGSVAVYTRHAELAARLFGAAEAALERLETTFSVTNRADYERALARLRAALSPDQLATAWRAGRATGLEEALHAASHLDQVAPPARAVADLTPRELEVARLVARGLTNRQVADTLVITEKTAANHLQHVLDKLEVRSRTHLAAQASQLGL